MNPTAEAPLKQTAAILHEDLVRKVKVIGSRRGGSIAENVTRFGGPGIDEEYRRVVDEMNAELGEAGA